jgi:7tm Chemosensory receptor
MAVYPLEGSKRDRSNVNLKMECSEENDGESFNGFRKVMFILRLTGNSFRGSQLSVEHPNKRYQCFLIAYEVVCVIFQLVMPIILFDEIQESHFLKTSSQKPILKGLAMIGGSTRFAVAWAVKWMTFIEGPRIFQLIESLQHEVKLENGRKLWSYFLYCYIFYLTATSFFNYGFFYYGKPDFLSTTLWWMLLSHALINISGCSSLISLLFVMGYFVWLMVSEIQGMKRKLESTNGVIKYWHYDLMKLKRKMEQIDRIISPLIAIMIVSNSIFLIALICTFVEMEPNLYNISMNMLSTAICMNEIIVCCMLGEWLPKEVDKFVDELELRLSCRTEGNGATNEIKEVKHSVELLMIHNLKSRINFSMFNEFNVRLSLLLTIGSVVISYTVTIIQTSF